MSNLIHITPSNLETIHGEPRMKDIHVAEALEFKNVRQIRELIKRHKKSLECFGSLSHGTTNPTNRGGRPAHEYYLNRKQTLYICTKSETPQAAQVTICMVEVFDDYMAGKAPAKPRIQHRPDAAGGDKRWIVPIDQRTHVATRIQDLREAQGISRRDLAARLGMNKYTVLRWERAETMPDRNAIKVLAKALSVDVKDILAGEVLPPDQQPAPPPSRPQGPRLNDDPEGYYQKHIAEHKEAYREMQESLIEARRMFNTLLDQISQHNAAQFSHAEHAKACRRMIKAN